MNDMKTYPIERMYQMPKPGLDPTSKTYEPGFPGSCKVTFLSQRMKPKNQNTINQKPLSTPVPPMTKLGIIDFIYRNQDYRQACMRITGGDELSDDLFHEMILVLMRYDDTKIIGLYTKGELKWFVVRVMMTMWRCKSSPFFQAYRKKSDSINERIQPSEDMYDLERDLATQRVLDATDKVLEEKLNSGNRNDWYEATMWKLYLSAGSFRKAQAQSKIPYKSIANTVRRMKLIIEERIKLEARRKD